MKFPKLFLLILCCATFSLTGCEKDDYYNDTNINTSNKTELSRPTLKSNLTTTTTTDLTFKAIYDNGGDIYEKMSCTVHWRRYGSKPSSTPRTSDMTNHESMRRLYTTKYSTAFDKAHTGFNRGDYIYYYFVCSNSQYTTTTDVRYCILTGK